MEVYGPLASPNKAPTENTIHPRKWLVSVSFCTRVWCTIIMWPCIVAVSDYSTILYQSSLLKRQLEPCLEMS